MSGQIVARAYLRISKIGGRADAGTLCSDLVQMDDARRLCERMGWELDEVNSHLDGDVSGYSKEWRERPQLIKHYRDLAEARQRGLPQPFQKLIVWKADRLGRGWIDSIDCWDTFATLGVDVYSAKEGVDASTQEGRRMRDMYLMMAQWQSEDISTRVTAALEMRARMGRRHGGRLPGWLIENDEGQIEVNWPVANALIRAVELRAEQGYGFTRIAQELNSEGHPTMRGAKWHASHINTLLSRSDWIDTLEGWAFLRRPGRTKKDKIRKVRVPLGETMRVGDRPVYPAIITPTQAEKLRIINQINQDRRANEIEKSGPRKSRSSNNPNYLLTGLVYCADCGGKYQTFQRARKDERREVPYGYRCYSKLQKENLPHSRASVSGNVLEDAVLRVVYHALSLVPLDEKTATPAPKKVKAEKTRTREDVLADMDRLAEMLLGGKLRQEIYDRRYAALDAELQEMEAPTEVEVIDLTKIIPSGDEPLTREQLKLIVQATVERVDFPVYREGEKTARGYGVNDRPYARVTLRPGVHARRAWLAPVYLSSYTGKREVYEEVDTASVL